MKVTRKMKNNSAAVLKLNTKPHTIFGIVSFVLALLALVFGILGIYFTAFLNQDTEKIILITGFLVFISAMLTFIGLTFAVIGEGTKDTEKVFAHISLFLHSIGVIFHCVVFWQGFIL